jgi:membrane protein DedA with SNARE-associated domain
VRAVIPLIAGISAMSWWPFQIANLASAALWAWWVPKFGDFGMQFLVWLWEWLGGRAGG